MSRRESETKTLVAGARQVVSPRNCLRVLERVWLARARASEKPQLFITGLPRSGTTLIYQYIVHRLFVAYFTNLVGRFPHSPCTVTFLQSRLHGEYRSDFKSNYGKVRGPVAPREAGAFWCRFFSLDGYHTHEELDPRRVDLLRRSVHATQRIFGDSPFVNKNVKHILRIQPLEEIFPNSFFLIVERSLEDVALSLLRARYAGANAGSWLSARPPDHDRLKNLPVEQQVAGQVVSLKAKLESDLVAVDSRRVLRICYEEFCKDPEALIRKVQSAIGGRRFKNPPESSFAASRNRPRTALEEELIERVRDGSLQRVP